MIRLDSCRDEDCAAGDPYCKSCRSWMYDPDDLQKIANKMHKKPRKPKELKLDGLTLQITKDEVSLDHWSAPKESLSLKELNKLKDWIERAIEHIEGLK